LKQNQIVEVSLVRKKGDKEGKPLASMIVIEFQPN
jgi:hypothetical protein